ncbi:PREDICTED: uncharacterized protein LOC108373633 [Rhagoletis zephyria]|uniref:uncharacterized protein LOC108373633 n=1 Tax=Rhagoletis zephyria TaxID=28612 RepID=UPI0008113338|nr:PREDICTED: uncharacterized protein LOC108373633 [Rhagoletis zephyria]
MKAQHLIALSYPPYKDDPFIPPRGRKHNLPDLDALLNRYETFVPNRGKRDKIKDLFKYNDLFFPNRGKKLKPPKAGTLALGGQWQRSPGDDEANEVTGSYSENEGNASDSEESVRLLDNQVDGNDDSNLTAPPVRDAIRRMQGGRKRHLQPHELGLAGSGRNAGADDGETIRILFDKSSDDNGNNYSDTIDNNLAAVVDGNGDGGKDAAAVTAIVNWLQSNRAITKNLFNENDQSVTSTFSAQQPLVRGAFTDPRMRRVARTFAAATRPAANHWRSMFSMTRQPLQTIRQQLHYDQRRRATVQQQQPTKSALRLYGRHLRHEQLQNEPRQKKQAQRRAAWQLSLLPTPARASNNDFEFLFARHLQQSNRPSMIVQHPSLTWWQPKQLQLQQHSLVGPVDDGVAARRSSSPENTETDCSDFSI